MAPLASCLERVRYNCRLISGKNAAAGLAYAFIVPLVFSLDYLNAKEAAQVGEIYCSVLGIILLGQLSELDFEARVAEIISAKRTGKGSTFIYRLLVALGLLSVLTAALLGYMALKDGEFDFLRLFSGILITGWFLGMLAITAANLLRNLAAGYLFSFSYYLIEYATRGRYTKRLYLFSLTNGSFTPKYYLLAGILLMVVLNILLLNRRNV